MVSAYGFPDNIILRGSLCKHGCRWLAEGVSWCHSYSCEPVVPGVCG